LGGGEGAYANHGHNAISASLGGVENRNALVVPEFLCSGRHDGGKMEELPVVRCRRTNSQVLMLPKMGRRASHSRVDSAFVNLSA
jgi:hypothetical protein